MPRQAAVRLLLLLLPLCASRGAAAQLSASFDAGVGTIQYDGYLRSNVLTVAPAVQIAAPLLLLEAAGAASIFESGSATITGVGEGAIFTSIWRGMRAELAGGGALSEYTVGASGREVRTIGRAHVGQANVGGWVGFGFRNAWSGREDRRSVPQAEAGVWARTGELAARATFHRARFRARPLECPRLPRCVFTYNDAELAATWEQERLELTASVGGRTGADIVEVTTWLGRVRFAIAPNLAIVGSAGHYAADPVQDLPGGRFATVGLRLTSRRWSGIEPLVRAAPAVAVGFDVQDGRATYRTLRVRALGARRVEIMGDFTDWEPIQLTPIRADLWEVTLPIVAGTHRVNLRVDGGGWTAPPGLATMSDDYGGVVGLLTLIGEEAPRTESPR